MTKLNARLQTPQEIELEMEQQKTKKYHYTITEYSADSRSWTITSDEKLTEEFLEENAGEFCDVGQSLISNRIFRNTPDGLYINLDGDLVDKEYIKKIEVSYNGTDYGDDTQQEIEGDFDEK